MSEELKPKNNNSVLIFILGCMTALGPFTIDMYLPSFQSIAKDFNTTVAQVSLTLSSYFLGLSVGQIFYGPLLDRFGRKRPIYFGLLIYILASLGCLTTKSIEALIILRALQAIGGCSAGVGAMAMVRDLFTVKESAKVFSLLILILGVSPLLAPTIGGFISTHFGWHSVFLILALMATTLLAVIKFFLKESHTPDPTVSLRLGPNLKSFLEIFMDVRFQTYVLAGAIAFSGLFVYLAGSPVVFLENFKVSAQMYSLIFAIVASGMIAASQLNVYLLKFFSNQKLLICGVAGQGSVSLILFLGSFLGLINLPLTVFLLFLYLGCFGITNPNSGALALAPFSKNAGRAAALMGFLQMGIGAVVSSSVGALGINQPSSIFFITTTTSFVALIILLFGVRRITQKNLG